VAQPFCTGALSGSLSTRPRCSVKATQGHGGALDLAVLGDWTESAQTYSLTGTLTVPGETTYTLLHFPPDLPLSLNLSNGGATEPWTLSAALVKIDALEDPAACGSGPVCWPVSGSIDGVFVKGQVLPGSFDTPTVSMHLEFLTGK
jgi:hypothetical protein